MSDLKEEEEQQSILNVPKATVAPKLTCIEAWLAFVHLATVSAHFVCPDAEIAGCRQFVPLGDAI